MFFKLILFPKSQVHRLVLTDHATSILDKHRFCEVSLALLLPRVLVFSKVREF